MNDIDKSIGYFIDFLPYIWNKKYEISECSRKYLALNNLPSLKNLRQKIETCSNTSKNFFDIYKCVRINDDDLYKEKIIERNLDLRVNGIKLDVDNVDNVDNFLEFFSMITSLSENKILRKNISTTLFKNVESKITLSKIEDDVIIFNLEIPKIKGYLYGKYSNDKIIKKFEAYRYIIRSSYIHYKYNVKFPNIIDACDYRDRSQNIKDFITEIKLTPKIKINMNINKPLLEYILENEYTCLRVKIDSYDCTFLFAKKLRITFCICNLDLILHLKNIRIDLKSILSELIKHKATLKDQDIKNFLRIVNSFKIYDHNNFISNFDLLSILEKIENRYSKDIFDNIYFYEEKRVYSETDSDLRIKNDWQLWFVEMIMLNINMTKDNTFYKDLCKNILYSILLKSDIIEYISDLTIDLSIEFTKHYDEFKNSSINTIDALDIRKLCNNYIFDVDEDDINDEEDDIILF